MEWVPIRTCDSELEAKIIEGKLQLENVKTKLNSDSLGAIYPGTILAGPVTVFIQKQDLEKANEILEVD